MVEDNQIWKADNFEAKIIHIPGHTTGHIGFYFFNEKLIFTGDTLFSLGCGRIFEGTYEQMFESLKKLKNLPEILKFIVVMNTLYKIQIFVLNMILKI